MKNKMKIYPIAWFLIILFIIIGVCSCEPVNIKPCLNGVFISDGIELVFDNGKLTGQTDCNLLDGEYFTEGNYINIDLKSTKVFCINEYKTAYFRDVSEYYLNQKQLILSGNDFEIILNKVK